MNLFEGKYGEEITPPFPDEFFKIVGLDLIWQLNFVI